MTTTICERLGGVLHWLLWWGHGVLLLNWKWHTGALIMLITAETVVVFPIMEVLLWIKASTTSEMPLIIVEWLLLVHALERLLHWLELRWLLPRLSILRHRAYRILSLKLSRLE